jgi:hypothetical protein
MKLVRVHDEYGMPIWIEISKVRTVQRQLGDAATSVSFDAKHAISIRETPEALQAAVAALENGREGRETAPLPAPPIAPPIA